MTARQNRSRKWSVLVVLAAMAAVVLTGPAGALAAGLEEGLPPGVLGSQSWGQGADGPEPPAWSRPRQPGVGVIARVLAELSGKSPEEVWQTMRDNRGEPAAVLEALGVDPAEFRQALQELRRKTGRFARRRNWFRHRLRPAFAEAVEVMTELSGKTREEVLSALRENRGIICLALDDLGVSHEEFTDAMRKVIPSGQPDQS